MERALSDRLSCEVLVRNWRLVACHCVVKT